MRLLWGLLVVVIGSVLTWFGATKLGSIGVMMAGPTVGKIFGIIVAGCGIALTIAFAISAVMPGKTHHPPS